VALVNPSGSSCGRTDSILGDDLMLALGRRAPGCAQPWEEWRDVVSDALCIPPSRLRDHGRFAPAAPRMRRRLPGPLGLAPLSFSRGTERLIDLSFRTWSLQMHRARGRRPGYRAFSPSVPRVVRCFGTPLGGLALIARAAFSASASTAVVLGRQLKTVQFFPSSS
jgi:hypothetical protein